MPDIYGLSFDGVILVRGFWLYVWEITVEDGCIVYYVGKTGDKSSGVSQSPFDRVSKHLGQNKNNNALRRHLSSRNIDPEKCCFRFLAYGPMFTNELTKTHAELCDTTSALEKALADAMRDVGYEVMNNVHCRMPVDSELFARIKAAFAACFPMLGGEVIAAGNGA